MNIEDIQKRLQEFAVERNWDQFHNPKNLAIALSVECSELLELFQWLSPEEAAQLVKIPAKRDQLSEEIADVALYLLRLSDKLGIDLEDAINKKLKINATKYPPEKVKGSSKKYNEYED